MQNYQYAPGSYDGAGTAVDAWVSSGGFEIVSTGTGNSTIQLSGGHIDFAELPYVAGGTASVDLSTDILTVVEGGRTMSGGDVQVAGPGSETLNGAAAANADLLFGGLSGGTSIVGGDGADTIVAGGGYDTITPNFGSVLAFADSASLTFTGGFAPATLVGGAGSLNVFDVTGGLFLGGTGGQNLLYAAGLAATLVGAGNGDMLWASGNGADVLVAGAAGEALNATASTGPMTLYGGSGSASVAAGAGSDLFEFFSGSGGSTTVLGFNTAIDRITLQGYAAGAASISAAAGTTVLNLPDGTNVTLTGVASLPAADLQ